MNDQVSRRSSHRYYFKYLDFNGSTYLIEVDSADVRAGRFTHVYYTGLPIDMSKVDAGLEVGGALVLLGTHAEVAAADLAFENAELGSDAVIHGVRFTTEANRYDYTAPYPQRQGHDVVSAG